MGSSGLGTKPVDQHDAMYTVPISQSPVQGSFAEASRVKACTDANRRDLCYTLSHVLR